MIADLKPYTAYKDSGLRCVGDVPAHWDTRRAKYSLREVDERSAIGDEELLSVSHITGVTPRREKNVSMFLAESNVGHKVCRPDDVVINTMWAWMAALGVARQSGLVSPSYAVYRPRSASALAPEYLDRLLRTPAYASEYLSRSTGVSTSRLRLYPEQFLDIRLLCPSEKEQALIIRFLDHADRRIRRYIRAKQKLIKLMEEQKQTTIDRVVTRGLDPDVQLEPSGISWLGNVPQHWELCRLRNVVSQVTSGSRGWSAYAADRGPLFIRVANLRRGSLRLRFDDVVRLDLPGASEAGRTRVRSGDLLLSITAYIGSVGVVPDGFEEAYVSQHVARCQPRPGQIAHWLGYVLLSRVGQTHGQISLYGGTKDGLSLDDVKNYPILLPPREEQSQLVDYLTRQLERFEALMASVSRQIRLVSEYRTRLIADVVTGKLDVHEAAADLHPATEKSSLPTYADLLLDDEEGPEGTDLRADAARDEAEV